MNEINKIIDENKLNEILNTNYDTSNQKLFSGLAWDNVFLGEIDKWTSKNYSEVTIEKNADDKYRFKYFIDENQVEYGKWNTLKSFGTVAYDFGLVNDNYVEVLSMKSPVAAVGYFLDKIINVNEMLEKFNEKNLLKYWRILAKYENFFSDRIRPRIMTILYKNVRHASGSVDYLDDFLAGTNKFSNLEKIIRPWIKEIVLNSYDKIEPITDENTKTLDNYFQKNENTYSITINELVRTIEEGKLVVPVFQRDYVWKQKKIISLLNSIKKNYPIGSLLLAKTGFKFETKNDIIEAIRTENSNDPFLLLDGQQRTTSLLLFIAYKKLREFINTQVEDAVLNEQLERAESIYYFNGEFYDKKDLIEIAKVNKNSISKYLLINPSTYEEAFNAIKEYKLTLIVIDKLVEGQLVEIFQNINSGNTKLTNIDLLHAAFYGQNKKINLLEKIAEMKQVNYIKNFGISDELIMQSWKIIFDKNNISEGKNISIDISIKSIFSISENRVDVDKFIAYTNLCKHAISVTIKIINNFIGFPDYKSLPNIAYFLSIFAYVISKDLVPKEDIGVKEFDVNNHSIEIRKIISRILKRTMNKDYSSGTAMKVNKDIEWIILNDFDDVSDINTSIDWKDYIEKEIKTLKYKSTNPLFKIVIAEMVCRKPLSLIDGETEVFANISLWHEMDKDMHHFVPKKCASLQSVTEKERDQIQNIVLIGSEENRSYIKTKSPFVYLLSESDNLSDDKIKVLERSHLFSEGDLIKIFRQDFNEEDIVIFEILGRRVENIINAILDKWFIN